MIFTRSWVRVPSGTLCPHMADRAHSGGSGSPTTERVRVVYRWGAPFYDAYRIVWSWLTRPIERELDDLFRTRIGPGTCILELGPGTGINVVRLLREAPRFGSYLGIDVSEPMLRRAQPRARGDARIVFRVGDATDLAAIDGSFDFIVSTWMLSHLAVPSEVVRSALAKLAPGGTAVFVFLSRLSVAPLRWLLDAFGSVFRYRRLDATWLDDHAGLERSSRCAAGMATLVVFRRARAE